MKEILNQLIKLQEIDNRLYEINELKGDLPSKVESQVLELKPIKIKIPKRLNVLKKLLKSVENLTEVEDFNHKLKKYQDQIYLVTSNKEYDALNAEIDHMKNSISSSETTILELKKKKLNWMNSLDRMKIKLSKLLNHLNQIEMNCLMHYLKQNLNKKSYKLVVNL